MPKIVKFFRKEKIKTTFAHKTKQELIKGHQGSNEWEKRSNESNDENERLEGREREEPNRIVVKD